jgi:hypothetical protein
MVTAPERIGVPSPARPSGPNSVRFTVQMPVGSEQKRVDILAGRVNRDRIEG